MDIRPATDDDWPQIYTFLARIVADGRTYAYPENLTEREAKALWMEPLPGATVVAVQDGVVLGSAKMGPNRPGRGAHIATASFMVDPAQQVRGIGRALGEHMIAWARDNGYHGIQFNAVVENNAAALHLWQALGFEIIGTVPDAFDHRELGLVGLHVMYRKL